MQMIDARGLDHKAINQKLREAGDVCALQGCCGQRFIAAGMADKAITIEGVPGNALGPISTARPSRFAATRRTRWATR